VDEIPLDLTEEEFSRVNRMRCDQAALEICRIHFGRSLPGVRFVPPGKGADLRVRHPDGIETDVEVKGTEALGIAWPKLKVSSQHSHDRLRSGMPLYRVTGIGSRAVKLFVMRHGEDFEMVPELRWSVRPPRSR
jgi:hypothetical protein